jgi:hypothetical protein
VFVRYKGMNEYVLEGLMEVLEINSNGTSEANLKRTGRRGFYHSYNTASCYAAFSLLTSNWMDQVCYIYLLD